MSGHRFLGYIQNPDQVGNRTMGGRLSQLVDPLRLKMASALVLTAPLVAMLFMGEEVGCLNPVSVFR